MAVNVSPVAGHVHAVHVGQPVGVAAPVVVINAVGAQFVTVVVVHAN